ncbi:MAG TPA: EamA family transporter, partial [Blastocatellia bacterium]
NAEASILSLVEPLTAVVAASLLLGERLAPLQVLGGALILGALAFSSLGKKPRMNADERGSA